MVEGRGRARRGVRGADGISHRKAGEGHGSGNACLMSWDGFSVSKADNASLWLLALKIGGASS